MIRNATREITRNYKVNGSMEIIYDYVGEDIRDKVGGAGAPRSSRRSSTRTNSKVP